MRARLSVALDFEKSNVGSGQTELLRLIEYFIKLAQ
jgi:hypothetical protein